MRWLFTATSDSVITRNIYMFVVSTIFLLPLFYVFYTAVDNTRVYLEMPIMLKKYTELQEVVNVKYNGDIHLLCENDECIDYMDKRVLPLINNPEFMAFLNSMSDDEISALEVIDDRWWWPYPLLRNSDDVKRMLYIYELERALLDDPNFDEIVGFNINRALILAMLTLIVINTMLSLLNIYVNDKKLKDGVRPISMYSAVSSASKVIYFSVLLKICLLASVGLIS